VGARPASIIQQTAPIHHSGKDKLFENQDKFFKNIFDKMKK
jgi:hypothetical protein